MKKNILVLPAFLSAIIISLAITALITKSSNNIHHNTTTNNVPVNQYDPETEELRLQTGYTNT